MIQSVSSVAPLAGTSATTTDDATSSATSSAQSSGMSALLAPNEFLSLLVDNLKYQDPLDPTSSADLLTQLAALSQVQTQQQIAETEQTSAAANLIGDTITGSDVSGSPITGVVSGFSLGTSGPTLDVGGSSVLLGNITAVDQTSTSSTSTPSNVSGASR
ncbi:MAG: flagellar hook capping FlgD N-terminal domain-containing protein [Acidimicrobiales bacterium]|jgi:flagellar basal-body rod modification protein FlgD